MAVDAPVVGFRASNGTAGAGVVVEADENGTIEAIGEGDPIVKIDKGIAAADKDGLELPFQFACETPSSVESETLFLVAGGGRDGARIGSSMTRVDDDQLESLRARAMTPWVTGEASPPPHRRSLRASAAKEEEKGEEAEFHGKGD